MALKWAQNDPKIGQDGHKVAQEAPDSPKIAKDGPKMVVLGSKSRQISEAKTMGNVKLLSLSESRSHKP